MNAYLNYLIEANLGLCLFLLMYVLFLKKETDFQVKRIFLLIAVTSSTLFPLIHFNVQSDVPRLGDIIPETWLPAITVTPDGIVDDTVAAAPTGNTVWSVIDGIYLVGFLTCLGLLLIRLTSLVVTIRRSGNFQRVGSFKIVESSEYKSSFSFFNFIFVGQANQLSENDKHQIIAHEAVHAKQYHSLDILLIHTLQIIFWFNPVVYLYKKIFIQLHEFEADSRAAENRDVNDYCSLVAKVALLSADIHLANHFSNSLTIKRIEMMRTIKTKIKRWKLVALATVLPAFFLFVACQDQVMEDATDIARNSTMTMDYPAEIQKKLDEMKAQAPGHKFVVIVPDEKGANSAANLQEQMKQYKPEGIQAMHVMKDIADRDGVKRNYIILDYDENAKAVAENAAGSDQVFMVVEEAATYPGGIEGLRSFLSENLVYPDAARTKGLEGTVFVSFIVEKNGSISDSKIVKGVDETLDKAALNLVSQMPSWSPGKQNGMAVRSRFVLPINFKLGTPVKTGQLQEVKNSFRIASTVKTIDGKKYVTGTVKDEANNPMAGANLIIAGSSSGTTTDMNGNFKLAVPEQGKVVVSFIGYETETINF